MKLMSRAAIAAALLACVSCASMNNDAPNYPPDQTPVGTTGTSGTTGNDPVQVSGANRNTIPVGQQLDTRLQTPLSSATAQAEQRFEATTAVDLMQGDRILIPAGSVVRGVVSNVDPAGKVDRTGRLTLSFDQITVNGRDYPMRAMATQVFESGGIREEVKTVGTAGAVGGIIGGILGGVKGALLGAVIGSGGVIAATEGKDIELPAGTIVRIRLDTPIQIRS